jgi:hypothetical protein
MTVIQANCRVQFTPEDVAFLLKSLARHGGQEASLASLLADPGSLDLLLDHEAVLRGVLEDEGCLQVSRHFYFYTLVRHALLKAGIDDREIADYVGSLLAEYGVQEKTRCRVPGRDGALDYFFEMMGALQTVDDRTAFFLRAQIGNQSLFLSGMFPERIRQRAKQRGFPDISYYRELGRTNFRVAGDHRLARRYSVDTLYHRLSDRFETARLALNDLSERLVFLGDSAFAQLRFGGG